MQTLLPYLAILVVILTGWGIAKKLQVTTLLLFAGLALNLLAILAGVDNILPRSAKTTGWIGFDLFELLRALSRSQIASTGFIILVAVALPPTWTRSVLRTSLLLSARSPCPSFPHRM